MSKQSEKVKKWRQHCKERIVAALGGSCCVCGYKKYFNNLALHHLDPSKKDFSFGAVRANPKNWAALVEELKKCILVCHNCHGEIHAGIIEVPINAPRFDEMFTDYKKLLTIEKVLTPCLMCGKLKGLDRKYCSVNCAGKANGKIDWNSIDLEEILQHKSMVQLAEELNCSEAAVRKRRKKLKLFQGG